MLSRLSEEGKWTTASEPTSPAAAGTSAASSSSRTQQLPPHPNYDHILPPNLERQQQQQTQPVHHRSTGFQLGQGATGSLLQVADAAPVNIPMSVPVGDTSLLVTRNPGGASSDYQGQPGVAGLNLVADQIPLLAMAPSASPFGISSDISSTGRVSLHLFPVLDRSSIYTEQICNYMDPCKNK